MLLGLLDVEVGGGVSLRVFGVFQARGANLPRFWVGMYPSKTKSRPIARARFFIEETPKTYKNDMNVLIFLDLIYNLCKNFNVQFFHIFTCNQGKIFLILPVTYYCIHVYLVFTGSCSPLVSGGKQEIKVVVKFCWSCCLETGRISGFSIEIGGCGSDPIACSEWWSYLKGGCDEKCVIECFFKSI